MASTTPFSDLAWPKRIPQKNSSESFFLWPNTAEFQQENDAEAVRTLCNQPLIYDFLFRKMLGGRPYDLDFARGFFNWSDEGWKSSQYFVFLLRNAAGDPVGCIDIKQFDLSGSEIGYWCSSAVNGVMSNTVAALCEWAGDVGFKNLRAIALFDNLRSQTVLKKNGFVWKEDFVEEGDQKRLFTKPL